MRWARGFTLIEVLVALTIFALIAMLSYAVVGPAGQGFQQLTRVRDHYENELLIGDQLRSDAAYSSASFDSQLVPLRLEPDERGNGSFDQLTMLVRVPGQPALMMVRYFIDEAKGELVRESRMAWARSNTPSQRWEMGKVSSLSIEAMDAQGIWQRRWPPEGSFVWPRALRIRIKRTDGTHEWLLPIPLGEFP